MASASQVTTTTGAKTSEPYKPDSDDEDTEELALIQKWEFQMNRLTKLKRKLDTLESRMVIMEEKLSDIETLEIKLKLKRPTKNAAE